MANPKVDALHPEHEEKREMWEDCRTVKEGGRAVKAAGERYLPKLSGKNADYTSYKRRSNFFNATERTVGGYLGMVFRRDPDVVVPDRIGTIPKDDFLRDVSSNDVSFNTLATQTFEEVLTVGRVGLLVDMPEGDDPLARAYITRYRAENILNWKTQKRAGDTLLTMVTLRESYEYEVDEFEVVSREQVRVLRLSAPAGGDEGSEVYTQEVWRRALDKDGNEKEDEWEVVVPMFTPTRRAAPLTRIPFFFANVWDTTPSVPKPPLIDLVDVNLSHYRTSADLENGRHLTGLPTPYVTGMSDDEEELEIGSNTAWIIPNEKARVGMLEFTGEGLGALEKAEERKERQMATLGARLLEEQKKDSEAAETVRLRQSGEQSILSGMAETTGEALTRALSFSVWWTGSDKEDAATVELNKDFFQAEMSPEEMVAITKAWQSGLISHETAYYNLKQGERSRPGVDFDEEKTAIETETPADLPGASSVEEVVEEVVEVG